MLYDFANCDRAQWGLVPRATEQLFEGLNLISGQPLPSLRLFLKLLILVLRELRCIGEALELAFELLAAAAVKLHFVSFQPRQCASGVDTPSIVDTTLKMYARDFASAISPKALASSPTKEPYGESRTDLRSNGAPWRLWFDVTSGAALDRVRAL